MPLIHSKKNKLKPIMAHVDEKQHIELKLFSEKLGITMSQVVREAIEMRLSTESPYVEGFNAGVDKCISTVNSITAAQMRFPSGKSFAELVCDELANQRMAANEATEG